MIYAEILAAGTGKRMGNTELPKQFLKLGSKPILIHTVEQFLLNKEIDKILIPTSAEWISYVEDLIKKYIGKTDRIIVIEGGATRDETVMSGCFYIKNNFGIKKDDIIITHDAVRPFVTQRIIEENIKASKNVDAVDTCFLATDTIIETYHNEDKLIKTIPNRKYIYQGQTPQTFNLKTLIELHNNLTEEEKESLTDACKIFVLKDQKVKVVDGEDFNIKITTMFDLKLADAILLERGNK